MNFIKTYAKVIMGKIMMNPSTNKWIHDYLELPILNFCHIIAFSTNPFGKIKNSIIKNIKTYKVFSTVFTILCIIYALGFQTSLTVIDYLKFEQNKLAEKIMSLNSDLKAETVEKLEYKSKYYDIIYSDDFMRYTVYKEANIMVPRNADMTHLKIMFREADKNKIPYGIIFRLVKKESEFINGLTSSAGAKGYMQVMPSTRKIYVKSLNLKIADPVEENIVIGTRMLKDMYDMYRKSNNEKISWKLALAAYNAGPGNVEKHGGIPPFVETQDYVKYIIQGLNK